MIEIHVLTACVDYAPLLAKSIERWAEAASLTVVTSKRDSKTAALAKAAGACVVKTEAFYQDGAYFNKGRAMQAGRGFLPPSGWHLFIDADLIPPQDWLSRIEANQPLVGTLYGARRISEEGLRIDDAEIAGYFQFFHTSDSRAAAPLDCDFVHAGNYDSTFWMRWPHDQRKWLALELVHLGETGVNWCGVKNRDALRRIFEARKTRDWRLERVGMVEEVADGGYRDKSRVS